MVLLLAAFLPLSGCKETFDFLPYAREIEDMALMRTLGVDLTAEGVRVTASTGIQDQGAKPPTILEEEARSISAACLSMQAQGAAYVFYGHVGQLLLGEDLARQGVRPALDYVMRDIEMRLETKLYVLQGGEAGAHIYWLLIGSFVVGATISASIAPHFGDRSSLFACIPLGAAFGLMFLKSDVFSDRME